MDDEDIRQQEFKLFIHPPDLTHPWHARLEREGEVLEFESPLELLAWLEAQFKRPTEGLR
ncbi:MAG TPA: hypothetical protein VFS50_12265 [Meiothermus sp.]|nr:hypothetical protein [Meiothermus sp.]